MAKGRFTSSEAIYEFLSDYINVEKGQATVFKLDRMRALATALGEPQKGRLTIHVAGSKGKGSVSTMCAAILAQSGLNAGVYTSPHILRWKERIALADGEMPEETLIAAAGEVLPLVEGRKPQDFPGGELPTFFELTTLIAFCAFRIEGCNAQVIEVGLGGRLDSTNIVDPDVSVITTIELEHTQFLGDTISKIAYEKAGIIKPGKTLCLSRQSGEAMVVFDQKAGELNCPVFKIGVHGDADEIGIDLEGTKCRLFVPSGIGSPLTGILPSGGLEIRSPMPGAIQAQNMALAALACAAALPRLQAPAVQRGLGRARLPARFEILHTLPRIVLDGAHTPESIHLCLETVEMLFRGPKVLLFACAHDKRHQEMAAILAPCFDEIIVTRPGSFKVSDPEAVHESFVAAGFSALLEKETEKAVELAIISARGLKAALIVAGSFYLCAEVKQWLARNSLEQG